MSFKPASPFSAPALPEGDHAFARLIARGDGVIVYANSAFEALCGQQGLKGSVLQDVMMFKNPQKAGESGLHLVRFPHGASACALQFDWIKSADGTSFLVASAQEQDHITPDILDLISDTTLSDDVSAFFSLSPDMMAICDRDGFFIRSNDAFKLIAGYDDTHLSERRLIDLILPEDRGQVMPGFQALLREPVLGTSIDIEARVMDTHHQPRLIEWRLTCTHTHIYVMGRDRTQNAGSVSDIARHEKQLREAEAIGHMGRWRWQAGETNIEWSQGVYDIFGLHPDSFTPTFDTVNQYMPRGDAGRMMQAFQRAMIARTDYDIDFRVIRPNGEKRYVLCQGRCEIDHEGDVIALYGIMQDVTAARLHEKALKSAKEDAERAYAARTQFLANMSHELRTPLNAVIGFSEMMERQLLGPIGNDKYLEYIRGIRESGEHLLDLITDILDMSKIEAGKYELAFEQINLAKTIRLALHMMEGRAMDSSIKLNAEFSREDVHIIADRRAVTQIMLNLLSNAVKFSKPGSPVHVACRDMESGMMIEVQDFGIGIPAHKIDVVTKPFEQAASHYTRQHEGTGLGLAITKELVELHGGTLLIKSTLGKGTKVSVHLPYDAAKAQKSPLQKKQA
ncbi:MAG: PAS domain-containing protein [Alphaproteobacteria bacterium]|nr:PAS domain-containing protein [Alphaproteobacteria bacterium]